ncbi:MAG: hypothetical protein RSA64_00715 [Christensenellaceae bacterium]
MIALVCDTPYQIISALYAAKSISKDEPIVFFLNQFWDNSSRKFEIEQDENIKIVYYGKEHMGMGLLLSSLYKPQKMLCRLEGYDTEMDFSHIITSRTAWMATYLYQYHIEKNPNLKLYLIEEGIGEYAAPIPDTRFTKACRLLHKKCQTDVIDAAYFCAPKLYPFQTNFPIYPLDCKENQLCVMQLVDKLFDVRAELSKIEPYQNIFLNEAPSANQDAQSYTDTEKSVVRACAEALGEKNFVVKLHPRMDQYTVGNIHTVYAKFPMEVLPAHVDMSNHVLISSMSTGLLTPKLLYDAEPTLVFTYQLMGDLYKECIPDEQTRNRYFGFIKGVCALYRDQSKILIPATLEELKEGLRAVHN